MQWRLTKNRGKSKKKWHRDDWQRNLKGKTVSGASREVNTVWRQRRTWKWLKKMGARLGGKKRGTKVRGTSAREKLLRHRGTEIKLISNSCRGKEKKDCKVNVTVTSMQPYKTSIRNQDFLYLNTHGDRKKNNHKLYYFLKKTCVTSHRKKNILIIFL